MRKYFTRFKHIIVVFLVVVNCCCFVCGCDWGWDWRGPYHHAAVVSTPKKTIVAGKKVYSLINEKLYKHNDGQLELIEFYRTSYGGLRISDVASDGENLFLVSYGSIFSLINILIKLRLFKYNNDTNWVLIIPYLIVFCISFLTIFLYWIYMCGALKLRSLLESSWFGGPLFLLLPMLILYYAIIRQIILDDCKNEKLDFTIHKNDKTKFDK